MEKKSSNTQSGDGRVRLVVPRDQARKRILQQIEKAGTVPNESINENEEARRWYEFTAELLRQISSTDELSDEFTGRGRAFSFGDITTARYLSKLKSIYERLDLYQEDIPVGTRSSSEDAFTIIKQLIDRFHTVTRHLGRRHDNRPTLSVTDEYDVQDLFRALLAIYFEDIRSEEWTPSYAGASSRMDFLLKAEKVVVEVKMTREKLGAKEVGEQLAIDIIKYRAHPDCRTLICFVYDPEERIPNPKGLEQDLSQPVGDMDVKVCVRHG